MADIDAILNFVIPILIFIIFGAIIYKIFKKYLDPLFEKAKDIMSSGKDKISESTSSIGYQ